MVISYDTFRHSRGFIVNMATVNFYNNDSPVESMELDQSQWMESYFYVQLVIYFAEVTFFFHFSLFSWNNIWIYLDFKDIYMFSKYKKILYFHWKIHLYNVVIKWEYTTQIWFKEKVTTELVLELQRLNKFRSLQFTLKKV